MEMGEGRVRRSEIPLLQGRCVSSSTLLSAHSSPEHEQLTLLSVCGAPVRLVLFPSPAELESREGVSFHRPSSPPAPLKLGRLELADLAPEWFPRFLCLVGGVPWSPIS